MRRSYEPEDPMTAFVSKYWEWGYRAVLLLTAGITLGKVQASYMTKDDVSGMISPLLLQSKENGLKIDAANMRVGSLETTLAVMAEQQKAISRAQDDLRELEKRIRQVEIHEPSGEMIR